MHGARHCSKQKRGPKQVSLEACDLGLGPGVVKGAYAQLPRYFKMQASAGRGVATDNLHGHIAGLHAEQATNNHFFPTGAVLRHGSPGDLYRRPVGGHEDQRSAIHAQEKAAYAIGERLFYHRAGPHDFSCAHLPSESGKRIRLQELPNLTVAKEAQGSYGTWPAYRVIAGYGAHYAAPHVRLLLANAVIHRSIIGGSHYRAGTIHGY